MPFVALIKSAEAGSSGANILQTVRTACEGTTETKVVVASAASAKSAVGTRRGCNGTPGKYNAFSRSQARRWARRWVRAQSLTSYPLSRQEIGQRRAPGARANDGDTCIVDVL